VEKSDSIAMQSLMRPPRARNIVLFLIVALCLLIASWREPLTTESKFHANQIAGVLQKWR
jgi:hypothetical protein